MPKNTVSEITNNDEAAHLGLVPAESAEHPLLPQRRRGLASAVVDIARSSWTSPTSGGMVGARSGRTSDADSDRLSSTGQALRGASLAGTSCSGTVGSHSGDGRGTPRAQSGGPRALHPPTSSHAKRLSLPVTASAHPQHGHSRLQTQPQPQRPAPPHRAHSPASANGGSQGSGPVDAGPRWPRDDPRLQAAVRAWWDWLPKTLPPGRRGQWRRGPAVGGSLHDSDSRFSVVSTSRGPSADGTPAEASQQQEGHGGEVAEKGREEVEQGEKAGAGEGRYYVGSLDSADGSGGDEGALDQATYSALVLAVASVLLPRFAVPSDIEYDPCNDWTYDSAGLPYMDYDHFYDVLLDLADAWSADSDSEGRAKLLETLLLDAQQRLGPPEGPPTDSAATDSVATAEADGTPVTSAPTTPRPSAPVVTFRQLLHTFRDRLQRTGTAAATAAAAAAADRTTSPSGGPAGMTTPGRSQPFLQLTVRPDAPASTSPSGTSDPSTPAPDPRLPSSPPHASSRSVSPSSYHSTFASSPGGTSSPPPLSPSPVFLTLPHHVSGPPPLHLQAFPHTHTHAHNLSPRPSVDAGGPGNGSFTGYGLSSPGGPTRSVVSPLGRSSAPSLVIPTSHPHAPQHPGATSPTLQRPGFQSAAPHPSQLSLSSQSPPLLVPSSSGSPRTRREGPFKLPQYSPVDVSGIRSTLGEYLREAPRRPDPATLEQWRRSRASARRGQCQQPGSARASSPGRESRSLTPTFMPLQPKLAEGESGESGVLMYEQYMHELAARYLARQEEVLVATSASAAAAAAQLLASASGAPPPGQPALETAAPGDGGPPPGFEAAVTGPSQMPSCHRGTMESPPAPHELTHSPLTTPGEAGETQAGEHAGLPRGTSPAPVLVPPPPLPPLLAPTIDIQAAMMEQLQPVCVVGHAMPVESTVSASGGSPTAASRVGWSKMSYRRRSNVTITVNTAVAAATSRPQSPTGQGYNTSTSPRVVALASVEGGGGGLGRGPSLPVQFPLTSSADMGGLPSHSDDEQQLTEAAAASSATQAQTQAQAQAQAQVVVAFAAAACRLADPNVHALLLPPHVYGNGATGSRHLSRRLSGGLSARGTAPRSLSGRQARPMTAAAGMAAAGQQSAVGAAVERFAPYMGPAAAAALNYLRPHVAPGGVDDSGDAVRPSGPTVAWDPTTVGNGDASRHHNLSPCPNPHPISRGEQQLRYSTDSPVHTPTSATAAAALLGGAVKRRLASSRTGGAGTTINSWSVGNAPVTPQHPSQAPSGGVFESVGQRPQSHAPPQPYSRPHLQPQAHTAYIEHPPSQGASSTVHGGMGATPTSPSIPGTEAGGGSGAGIGAVGTRWQAGSSTCGYGPGLAQTPRTALLPSGSTSRRGSNSSGGNGGTCGAVGVGNRRFCGGPAAAAAVVGGNGAGVVMPHAAMGGKLRNLYAASPSSPLPSEGPPTHITAQATTGNGGAEELDPSAGAVTSPGAMSASDAAARDGPTSAVNVGSISVPGISLASRRAISASYGATPRQLSASGPVLADQGAVTAAPAWTGAPYGVMAVRSPMRIRSSDPVGFSDAVTATRMNVAIMADELVQRQAEQRAQARLLRERTLRLRPSTAKVRSSYQQSFGAFLAAARESAGAISVSLGYDVARG